MVKKSDPNIKGRMKRRKVKKVKKRRRIWLFLIPFLIIGFLALGWGTYIYIKAGSAISDSYEDIGRDKSELREELVDPTVDNVSVLIMGVDENDHRDNKGASRTDALILATLNKDEKSVKLLSIPRDSYVYIPERGYKDKINHAHYFGGTESTIDTVERLLDIPVDYFVKLNFHAFIEVVDALGGVTVEVPYEFRESNSMDQRDAIHLLEGEQLLDGEEALAFARTRKHDSDVARGQRQLEIIKSVVDKSASLSSVFKYDDVIEAIGDNMTTNMTFSEIKSFISYGTKGLNLDVESYTLEGTDYWPENVYYWMVDEEALEDTKTLLKDHLEYSGTLSANDHHEGKMEKGEAKQ